MIYKEALNALQQGKAVFRNGWAGTMLENEAVSMANENDLYPHGAIFSHPLIEEPSSDNSERVYFDREDRLAADWVIVGEESEENFETSAGASDEI